MKQLEVFEFGDTDFLVMLPESFTQDKDRKAISHLWKVDGQLADQIGTQIRWNLGFEFKLLDMNQQQNKRK